MAHENEHKPSPIMMFFAYQHLREGLPRDLSMAVGELAKVMDGTLPPSAELSAGLRKLLEAKDCFVRAAIEATGTYAVVAQAYPPGRLS